MTRRQRTGCAGIAILIAVATLPAQPTGPDRIPPLLLQRLTAGERVRLIVELREPVEDESLPGGRERAARRRADVQQRFLSAVGGRAHKRLKSRAIVALEVDGHGVDELTNSPEVVSVREDELRAPTLAGSVPLVGAPEAWSLGATGQGWTIAVLDTGVDKTHPFLAGKVVTEACYSTSDYSLSVFSICHDVIYGEGPESGAPCPQWIHGCDHGTHVAGIAAGRSATVNGVARNATIAAIQVFTVVFNAFLCPDGPCTLAYDSDILAGLDRVYALRTAFDIAAVNLSLGSGLYTSHCDAQLPAYKSMIDQLRADGIATIISSGNSGAGNAVGAPACISSAISVGATTKSNTIAPYSNRGTLLSLFAPGSAISSSVPGGGFAIKSGTSMAAPHVSGAWAVLKSRQPGASVSTVLATLQTTGLSIVDYVTGVARRRIRVGTATQQTAPGGPTILSLRAEPSLPQPANVPITWTTRAFTGTAAPEYKYWIFEPHTGGWRVLRDYALDRAVQWTPRFPGTYALQVWIRAQGSAATYQAWRSSGYFTITTEPVSIDAVTANVSPPLLAGVPVTFTARGRGGTGPLEYEFWTVDPVTTTALLVRPYALQNTYTWTPEAARSGSIVIRVRARTSGSSAAFEAQHDSEPFGLLGTTSFVLNSTPGDYIGQGEYQIHGGPLWLVTPGIAYDVNSVRIAFQQSPSYWNFDFSAAGFVPLTPGPHEHARRLVFTNITNPGMWISGDHRGCNEVSGRFVVQDIAYAGDTLTRFAADFEQRCETLMPPLYGSVRFNSLVPPSDRPIHIQSVSLTGTLPGQVGTSLTWTTTAVGGGPPLQYKYWVHSASTGWVVVQDGASNVLTWTPTSPGTHAMQVWVRSLNSLANYEAWRGTGYFNVAGTPAKLSSFTSSVTFPVAVNTPVTWTATATTGAEYQFWLYNGNLGAWSVVQPYGSSGSLTWQPSAPGTYAVQVWVRPAGSSVNYEDWRSTGYFTVTP